MFLAIDIGNTQTNFAIFNKKKIIISFYSSTKKLCNEKTLNEFIRDSFDTFKLKFKSIDGIGISSVVPKCDNIYKKVIKNIFLMEPFFISSKIKLPFEILADNPTQAGADRICNVAAAYNKYKKAVVIVDFGTATNYDVVSKEGNFCGGVIAPGIKISAEALFNAAAKLPKVNLEFTKRVIGTNTIDNMQSGIMYSALFAMEGIIKVIAKELKTKPVVIATGGFSKVIASHTKMIHHLETNLVLSGIKFLYDYNKK